MSKICDGSLDCADGKDEKHLLCYSKLLIDTDDVKTFDSFSTKTFLKSHFVVSMCFRTDHNIMHKLTMNEICDGREHCVSRVDEWGFNCTLLTFKHAFRCVKDKSLIQMGPMLYLYRKVYAYNVKILRFSNCDHFDDVLLFHMIAPYVKSQFLTAKG